MRRILELKKPHEKQRGFIGHSICKWKMPATEIVNRIPRGDLRSHGAGPARMLAPSCSSLQCECGIERAAASYTNVGGVLVDPIVFVTIESVRTCRVEYAVGTIGCYYRPSQRYFGRTGTRNPIIPVAAERTIVDRDHKRGCTGSVIDVNSIRNVFTGDAVGDGDSRCPAAAKSLDCKSESIIRRHHVVDDSRRGGRAANWKIIDTHFHVRKERIFNYEVNSARGWRKQNPGLSKIL